MTRDGEVPESNEYMLVGGRRNGEYRKFTPDKTQWTDIADGVTYYKRVLPVVETNALSGERNGYYRWVFVHEQIDSPQLMHNTASMAKFIEWMRGGGTFNPAGGRPPTSEVEPADQPATSGLIVPGRE